MFWTYYIQHLGNNFSHYLFNAYEKPKDNQSLNYLFFLFFIGSIELVNNFKSLPIKINWKLSNAYVISNMQYNQALWSHNIIMFSPNLGYNYNKLNASPSLLNICMKWQSTGWKFYILNNNTYLLNSTYHRLHEEICHTICLHTLQYMYYNMFAYLI